ncbi:hypothetical protein CEXT_5731 [Caerostris extrusa]|uniref:Uncharacterized protein n=1 Tax=Caerostris extrusa TaxID=172846 RepID=A0AAV4UYH0_CAEEX|nr:hypothetical protein CEXT_5731 [Caerostris extrusa]
MKGHKDMMDIDGVAGNIRELRAFNLSILAKLSQTPIDSSRVQNPLFPRGYCYHIINPFHSTPDSLSLNGTMHKQLPLFFFQQCPDEDFSMSLCNRTLTFQ